MSNTVASAMAKGTMWVACLTAGLFALGAHAAALDSPRITAQTAATQAAPARVSTRITVTVPQGDAELVIDGTTMPGAGTVREFDTPPLAAGTPQRYTFTATWEPNTYTTMTRTRTVTFAAGDRVALDLTAHDPGDRVRVRYVPTPADIAAEMVRLAAVTSSDVVYEPGCGDARVTIAAVRAGARRGVGIDIDPERVVEARDNVEAAGLGDRIEIRLGDALDIQDLSAASVVFLYMGDHFNLLIRPILWRDLKVGARIVSHRFEMGDWPPDKTVTVSGEEGGDYELHLWTVTEALKRRTARPAAGSHLR